MLQRFLKNLSEELSIPFPKQSDKKIFSFVLNDELTIYLRDLEPGLSMNAQILSCPDKKKEDLFIYLMRANLLGQGTNRARIGLDSDEKTLTLLLGLPYEINYQLFKETFEDFVNHLVFWRNEIKRFNNETTPY